MRTTLLVMVVAVSILAGCSGDCIVGGVSGSSQLAGDIGVNQVLLEVRFVSLNQDSTDELGIQWQGLDSEPGAAMGGGHGANGSTVVVPTNLVGGENNGNGVFFPNQNGGRLVPALNASAQGFATPPPGCFFFDPSGFGASNAVQNQYDLTFPNGTTTANPIGLQFGHSILDSLTLSNLLQTIQQDQENRVLAAPQLGLLNGQTAAVSSKHIGVQFGDLQQNVRNDLTRTDSSIEFVETGFTLHVTPTIIPGTNQIQMDIFPGAQLVTADVLAGGENPQERIALPLLFESNARTTVIIPDGMTLVLGQQGFLGSPERRDGVPIFGDIPVLGSFFNNESNTDDRNLLIFVTARLVSPDR